MISNVICVFDIAVKDKKSCNTLPRMDEDTCLFPVDEKAVEYYFASDARSVPFRFASSIHFLYWFYLYNVQREFVCTGVSSTRGKTQKEWSGFKQNMCLNGLNWCHCSAVIEHTNRVIFLEDDDIAAVRDGRLSIHRIKRTAGDHPARAIQTLQMELQQIMKGKDRCISYTKIARADWNCHFQPDWLASAHSQVFISVLDTKFQGRSFQRKH